MHGPLARAVLVWRGPVPANYFMRTKIPRGVFAVLFCLATFAVRAGDSSPVKSVLFRDGQVTVVREDGNRAAATNTIAFPGSIQVMTNGTFTVGEGRKRKLASGDSLGADGNLTSPDGTVTPVADHIVMKRGRLMLVKDGDSAPVTSEVSLGNGSRVKPDGSVTGSDGRVSRMLDGQIARLSGAAIPTTDTVTVKNGVVSLQKDGGRVTLRRGQSIMMSDGTKVLGDGTVIKPDGTKTKVAEGAIHKVTGVSTTGGK